ncbi:BSD domain-containing protein 1 [Chytriomyces hyalinus]|nr:BSD domain-containing protein 1 [Chytriomyces hyalinus]
MDPKQEPPAQEAPSTGGWGMWGSVAAAMPSWDTIVDTVKKQTDVVANVLERDISEFISVVAPSDPGATAMSAEESVSDGPATSKNTSIMTNSAADPDMNTNSPTQHQQQQQEDGEPIESWRLDPDTGVLHAENTRYKETDNDAISPKVNQVVESTVAKLGALVDSADNLLDQAETFLEKVDVSETVHKIEALADKAEDFLESVEKGVWGFMSSAISMIPSATGAASKTVPNKSSIIFDRRTATILSLRHAESTYILDPSKPTSTATSELDLAQRYTEYKNRFDITHYSGQIARIFEDDHEVRALLTKIVPSKVNYDEFWMRYFFRVSEVDREEEARKRLMNDADLNEEEFAWDDDSSDEEKDESTTADVQNPPSTQPEAERVTQPETPKQNAPAKHRTLDAATPTPINTENLTPASSANTELSSTRVQPISKEDEIAALLAETSVTPTDGEQSPTRFANETVETLRKSTDASSVGPVASGSDTSYDILSEKAGVASDATSDSGRVSALEIAEKPIKKKPATADGSGGEEEEPADWDTWE